MSSPESLAWHSEGDWLLQAYLLAPTSQIGSLRRPKKTVGGSALTPLPVVSGRGARGVVAVHLLALGF